MKNHIEITITAKNADEFDDFVPVDGSFDILSCDEEIAVDDIRESIVNWMDADCDLEIYHDDGRAITDNVPRSGTFIAIKK